MFHKFPLQIHKNASENAKKFWRAAGYFPCYGWTSFAKLFSFQNSDPDQLFSNFSEIAL